MDGKEQYDEMTHWRCPPLGGPVPFSHCRKVGDGLPCGFMIKCWSGSLDVEKYLTENYSREEIEQMSARAGSDRLDTILKVLNNQE